jgi:cellulose synthase/poly-beta-1,6-N-acetylglucosamine synthase-like glycosyltransferase
VSALLSTSVVVPVRNGASTIRGMLTALMPVVIALPGTEVIVVDNGSTDRTREIVADFDVTLLHEAKRGPSAARNCGLRASKGEVVAHLDADTLPTRRWLQELVAPFANPRVMMTGGHTLTYRPETPAERYGAASGRSDPNTTVYREIFPFVPSENLAVRREAALAVGGWAEDMIMGEDVDFSHRVQREYGCGIVYCPNAIVFHQNRSDDRGLCAQAWGYGQGAAHVYRRYPEVVRWDALKTANVARVVVGRATSAALGVIGRRLHLVSSERAEFARYHSMWTWWWWRGFFSMYRNGEYRAAPVGGS